MLSALLNKLKLNKATTLFKVKQLGTNTASSQHTSGLCNIYLFEMKMRTMSCLFGAVLPLAVDAC